jgi:hypothetical protein
MITMGGVGGGGSLPVYDTPNLRFQMGLFFICKVLKLIFGSVHLIGNLGLTS